MTLPKIESLHKPIDFFGKCWIVKVITKEDMKEVSSREWEDWEMEEVARKLADALGDDFWMALKEVVEIYEEEKEWKEMTKLCDKR